MNARKAGPRVALLLVLLGVALVVLRFRSRQDMPMARGDSLWRLVYTCTMRAEREGAQVRLAYPLDTTHSRVFRQDDLSSPRLTADARRKRRPTRETVAVARQSGDIELRRSFDIVLSGGAGSQPAETAVRLRPQDREKYLEAEKTVQVDSPVVVRTLERLQIGPVAKRELVARLFEYCQTQVGPGGRDAPRDAAAALEKGMGSPLGRARALIALCRASSVPARLVTGFELKIGADVQPHRWVEVLTDGRWEPYDPENGFARELPRTFVPVRRDGVEIVRGTDVSNLRSTFSIARLPSPTEITAGEGRGAAEILDLSRLPLPVHEVLSLILLLPLGGLVTAIFRTVIGIRTFGTFSPTLLALSFVYNDWRMGLVVLAVVMVVGLFSRAVLDRLKLLVVPRLGVMLTLVVLCLVFGVSVFEYLGATPSAQVVLLPMVILTMTVERFYLASEEDGIRFAVQLMAGTLLVAFCCYLLLCWKQVGQRLLVYPELHCFTIAALILLGRYSGYRLTELWRFRDVSGG